jgi:hypothetical protein
MSSCAISPSATIAARKKGHDAIDGWTPVYGKRWPSQFIVKLPRSRPRITVQSKTDGFPGGKCMSTFAENTLASLKQDVLV